MGVKGPTPDTCTIGGVTKTYEEWGKQVGISKEGFRHRYKNLGDGHPMLLEDKKTVAAWRRKNVGVKLRERYVKKHGMTPEERKLKMRDVWSGKRNARVAARRMVLRVGESGSVDGMMSEDGTSNADWRALCEQEQEWRDKTGRGVLANAQKNWGRLMDDYIENVVAHRNSGDVGIYNLVMKLAEMELEEAIAPA